ncbi:caspase domain-containing protein [Microbispora bryophytorum]|uniref:caspase family protein n=1 Tax=Microbispora bryophytorum TaxID=1460882 RepID=UPI00371A643B
MCNSFYPADTAALKPLMGPRKDGPLMWSTLVDRQIGIFAEENANCLFEVDSHELLREVNKFFSAAKSDDVLLFYFSGHGKFDTDSLYLCCRDTQTALLHSTAAPSKQIATMAAKCKAGVIIVILDCCHAGAFDYAKKGEVIDNALAQFRGEGRYVLAAVGAIELADDAVEFGRPSEYTAAVVEGIRVLSSEGVNDLIYLDQLADYIEARAGRIDARPVRKVEGSGRIAISRGMLTDADDKISASSQPWNNVATEGDHRSRAATRAPSAIPIEGRQKGGEGWADLRASACQALLAIIAILSAVYSYHEWPRGDDCGIDNFCFREDRPLALAVCFLAGISLVAALWDWLQIKRADISPDLKGVREVLHAPMRSYTRGARIGISLAACVLSSLGIFELGRILSFTVNGVIGQNYSPAWALAMAAIIGCGLIDIFILGRRGDSMLASGVVLIGASCLLPFGGSSAIYDGFWGVFQFCLALVLYVAWWFNWRPIWKALILLTCLPILTTLDHISVGPFVALIGVLIAGLGAFARMDSESVSS